MKYLPVVLAAIVSFPVIADDQPNSLEWTVASIDANRKLDVADTSIARVKGLLAAAQDIYRTPQSKLADMAARAKKIAKDKKLDVTIAELLDFALIACETKCTETDFSENVTRYIIARSSARQTHHQATHGIVIWDNLNKRLK